ncbi:MAG: desulfoferrodoxin [Ruminococcaceae bacterium]|nr:desulfoferrodoxin [Oscillospiraceae bacterium]
MKQKFFFCKHCGNVVAKLHDRGTTYCCGEKMQELVPGTTEAAEEKHLPVWKQEGNVVHVAVGAAAHPMTAEHYIEWVCLETEHGIQYTHLDPTDEPRAKFAICDGDEVRAVYAFCNQHALWKV